MKPLTSRRGVWIAMALLSCFYAAFVVFTRPGSYGLTLPPEGHAVWAAIRLSTFSLWLAVAALLLAARRSPISWRCFGYAFLGSCLPAMAAASSIVPSDASNVAVAGTIGVYGSLSGFLCIASTRPWLALILGALLFPIQLLVDAGGHLLSGQFRLH